MAERRNISVAMVTYNGEKFVREQLDSIARQTRLPQQLVIVDDCSTDSTPHILHQFAQQTSAFPVQVHINPVNVGSKAKGITRNFETAARLCQGDLIVPSDQDDIWVDHKLARMAAEMESRPGLAAVFSDGQLVDIAGKPKGIHLSETTGLNRAEQAQIARGDALPLVLSMTRVYGSTLMYDARLNQHLPVPTHWWFDAYIGAMAATHGGLGFIAEDLYHYRIHPNQSVSARLQTTASRLERWRKSAADYWAASEPQLQDLTDKLKSEDDPSLQPFLEYLAGRMDLLRFRAQLPPNRIPRTLSILSRSADYKRFFNGWKSVLKDLTA